MARHGRHRSATPRVSDDPDSAALERVIELCDRWKRSPLMRVAAAELEDAIAPPAISTGTTGEQPAVLLVKPSDFAAFTDD